MVEKPNLPNVCLWTVMARDASKFNFQGWRFTIGSELIEAAQYL
jgi:hypothetical protein